MIRKDKVLSNVAVGNDQSIHADRFEQALRARASGDPANEHDVPVGRVLDGLGAEIGNEVEQIDDALDRGDIRSVSAAPVTVSETARRTLTSLVADMARLLCFGTLRNEALSCHVPEADKRVGSRDEHVRSGAVCRLRRR
jgi:hypothetical protein